MRKDKAMPAGTIDRLTVTSEALAGNMLGDPVDRRVDVYVPAGHDGSGLPLLIDLVGFTAGGPAHTNWKNFTENVPERLDRLIATGAMAPVVVAFPDCFTRLGGNQYINSLSLGRWEDFIIGEMLPTVETRYDCGGTGRRGLFGKSSGGYGSIIHALRHGGEIWAAAACHSGDMAFELCYLRDMPMALRALAKHDGSIEKFIDAFEADKKPSGDDIHVLMTLAMAATYDPDPDAFLGLRLPVDPHTCEIVAERWAAWTAWDPLTVAQDPTAQQRLKSMKGLLIDCGTTDQYDLVYGARRLHRLLEGAGVPHVYQEFPDNHSSIDYRMDVSLPYLAKALS